MSKRAKMSRQGSKEHFTRNAVRVHPKNNPPPRGMPMRGGIRM